MKSFADWVIQKVANWLFSPPIGKPKKTFTEISGWDDLNCFYAGEYEDIWAKKKKSRWYFWKTKLPGPQKIG